MYAFISTRILIVIKNFETFLGLFAFLGVSFHSTECRNVKYCFQILIKSIDCT